MSYAHPSCAPGDLLAVCVCFLSLSFWGLFGWCLDLAASAVDRFTKEPVRLNMRPLSLTTKSAPDKNLLFIYFGMIVVCNVLDCTS